MPPRTRSSGAPPAGHQQLNNEAPKTPSKRARDEDESGSEREAKRPQTEPRRGLPIFQRNQSYVARNRARWQQEAQAQARAQSARGPRFTDVTETPILRPAERRDAATVSASASAVRPSIEQDETSATPETRQSTLSWLMAIPGRLFSPAPPRPTPSQSPPAAPQSSSSPTTGNNDALALPAPQSIMSDIFTTEPPPRPLIPGAAAAYKRRRIERGNHKAPTVDPDDPELDTFQVQGSNKRKIATNRFELQYSDDENSDSDDKPVPATLPRSSTHYASPLKSALRSTVGPATGKKLRINDTPTKIRRLYGHYGPAGEYHGSTFADKSNNSFSTADSSVNKSSLSDDSSIPADSGEVRRVTMNDETRANTFTNLLPASTDDMASIFPSPKKPFVQPNSFTVPDFDSDDEEETLPLDDSNAATTPATPRMSHAELPETPQPADNGETPQDATARKESEEAAIKKAREQAQKYKPKTSSRLSTVEEKSRSRSSSPPASATAEAIIDRDEQERQGNAEEPYPAPYPWSKPVRPSYSTQDTFYEPTVFDDTHIGPDGMTDKQRRAARDAAADAWVAENVKWPEPLSYVDAGLCSPYMDQLMKTEICEEGKQRADEFYDKQFQDLLKWSYLEKAKGNQCALTWDNGRQEMVW